MIIGEDDITDMNDLATKIHHWSVLKGFDSPTSILGSPNDQLTLAKLMLVVSEVGEAAEAVRKADESNFEEEIADTIIRLLQLCGAMGINPDCIVRRKMEFNASRPPRHGKVSAV